MTCEGVTLLQMAVPPSGGIFDGGGLPEVVSPISRSTEAGTARRRREGMRQDADRSGPHTPCAESGVGGSWRSLGHDALKTEDLWPSGSAAGVECTGWRGVLAAHGVCGPLRFEGGGMLDANSLFVRLSRFSREPSTVPWCTDSAASLPPW